MVSALGSMISTLEAFFSWRRHGEVGKRLRGHYGDMVMQERASWRKAGASRGCEKGDQALSALMPCMRLARSGGSLPGTGGVQTLCDGDDSLLHTGN
jgi:hypothetical protein